MNRGAINMTIGAMVTLAAAGGLLLVAFLLTGSLGKETPGIIDDSKKATGLDELLDETLADLCPSGAVSDIQDISLSDRAGNKVGGNNAFSKNLDLLRSCPDLNGGSCIVHTLYRYQKLDAASGAGDERGELLFRIIQPGEAGVPEETRFNSPLLIDNSDAAGTWFGRPNIIHDATIRVDRAYSDNQDYRFVSEYSHYEGNNAENTDLHQYRFEAETAVCCGEGFNVVEYPGVIPGQIASGACVREDKTSPENDRSTVCLQTRSGSDSGTDSPVSFCVSNGESQTCYSLDHREREFSGGNKEWNDFEPNSFTCYQKSSTEENILIPSGSEIYLSISGADAWFPRRMVVFRDGIEVKDIEYSSNYCLSTENENGCVAVRETLRESV